MNGRFLWSLFVLHFFDTSRVDYRTTIFNFMIFLTLLIAWNRVLPEKPIVAQIVKKIPHCLQNSTVWLTRSQEYALYPVRDSWIKSTFSLFLHMRKSPEWFRLFTFPIPNFLLNSHIHLFSISYCLNWWLIIPVNNIYCNLVFFPFFSIFSLFLLGPNICSNSLQIYYFLHISFLSGISQNTCSSLHYDPPAITSWVDEYFFLHENANTEL
jgi:hypothetical protein